MDYDPEVAKELDSIMRDFPSAKAGKMFGMPGYSVNGKLAVAVFRDGVVVKVGAARKQELVGTPGITTFEPGGRNWKEWVKITANPHSQRALLEEAVHYVEANG